MTYLTKAEALKKICPYIRHGSSSIDGNGHRTVEYYNGSCVSDACMAWRWAGALPVTEKGYCGLAGSPISYPKE